jgi:D-lactate dehydrogenase (cytochrome)
MILQRSTKQILQRRTQATHFLSTLSRSCDSVLDYILSNPDLAHVQISQNKYDLDSHGRGEGHHPCAAPSAVLIPTSAQDVSHILSMCNKHKVPIIPFGAGTSVEGHLSALNQESISLDMKKFKEVDLPSNGILEDACIEVGAGVTRHELNDHLR